MPATESGWQLPDQPVRGVFAQGGRAGDRANTFVLPGYARVDAMAAYRFPLGGAKGQLQFNVNNLFDREYFTLAVDR